MKKGIDMAIDNVVKSIKGHEGFRSKPYIDPLVKKYPVKHGIPLDDFKIIEKHFDKLTVTIGYGFTFLTEEESTAVLEIRVKSIYDTLSTKIEKFDDLPEIAREVLVEMAYQMGWPTLLKFKRTLKYIQNYDFKNAAVEMLDSNWARDTKARAIELSNKLKSLA